MRACALSRGFSPQAAWAICGSSTWWPPSSHCAACTAPSTETHGQTYISPFPASLTLSLPFRGCDPFHTQGNRSFLVASHCEKLDFSDLFAAVASFAASLLADLCGAAQDLGSMAAYSKSSLRRSGKRRRGGGGGCTPNCALEGPGIRLTGEVKFAVVWILR